jgi:hypothetical protein
MPIRCCETVSETLDSDLTAPVQPVLWLTQLLSRKDTKMEGVCGVESSTSMQSPLPMLPRSILGFVIQLLTPGEALRLAVVCKEMKKAVTEEAEGYWEEQAIRLGWARCVTGLCCMP